MEKSFPTEGLRGPHQVPSSGIVVVSTAGIKLEAHHVTGTVVDFDHPLLHRFLNNLAKVGVGKLEKYDGVEYEFTDV
jgi:hypothetical protein